MLRAYKSEKERCQADLEETLRNFSAPAWQAEQQMEELAASAACTQSCLDSLQSLLAGTRKRQVKGPPALRQVPDATMPSSLVRAASPAGRIGMSCLRRGHAKDVSALPSGAEIKSKSRDRSTIQAADGSVISSKLLSTAPKRPRDEKDEECFTPTHAPACLQATAGHHAPASTDSEVVKSRKTSLHQHTGEAQIRVPAHEHHANGTSHRDPVSSSNSDEMQTNAAGGVAQRWKQLPTIPKKHKPDKQEVIHIDMTTPPSSP